MAPVWCFSGLSPDPCRTGARTYLPTGRPKEILRKPCNRRVPADTLRAKHCPGRYRERHRGNGPAIMAPVPGSRTCLACTGRNGDGSYRTSAILEDGPTQGNRNVRSSGSTYGSTFGGLEETLSRCYSVPALRANGVRTDPIRSPCHGASQNARSLPSSLRTHCRYLRGRSTAEKEARQNGD